MNKEELKKKWENYWYYYKYHTIAGIFILILLTVVIQSVIERVNPDQTVLMVTNNYVKADDITLLENCITKYTDDYTGNKKQEVVINSAYLSDNQEYMQLKIVRELSVWSSFIFITDETEIKYFLDKDLYSDITDIAPNAENGGKTIKVDTAKLIGKDTTLPKQIYFGIRTYDQNDKAIAKEAQKAKDTLKKLLDSIK